MADASGNAGRAGLSGQVGAAAERCPRRLTTHQKAVLIQVLLAFPEETVAVRYLPSASDARNCANDFSTIHDPHRWKPPLSNLPRIPEGFRRGPDKLAESGSKMTLACKTSLQRDVRNPEICF